MKRIFALLLILAAAAGLAACGRSGRPGAPVSQTPDVSSGETQSDAEAASSNILIAYVPDSRGGHHPKLRSAAPADPGRRPV